MESEQIEFEIKGVAPLKMDRWTDEKQPKNEEGYKKQAPKKVYKNNKGEICIPAIALKAAMRLAASEVGKKMEAKKNRQTISSAVFIEPDNLGLGKRKPDEIVRDIVSRGVGVKVTRVPTYRPLIKEGWKASGTLKLFGVPKEFVKECMQLAGIRYGLLSHRPEFGRFVITKWGGQNGTDN